MKKTLSVVLAIVMALSVFSGISFSAFAAQAKSVEVKLSDPLTIIEHTGGEWCPEYGDDYYGYYWPGFFEGDYIVAKLSNGTIKNYYYKDFDDDAIYDDNYDCFIAYDGDIIYYQVDGYLSQQGNWGLGEHEFIVIFHDDYDYWESSWEFYVDVPVTIIESSVDSVKTSFTVKDVIENTNGYWGIDEDDNNYFHYVPDYLFEEGDRITLNMKDGSSVAYTFKELYFEEEDWSNYAFINDAGEELSVVFDLDNQYDEHWDLGTHEFYPFLPDYGIDFAFSVDIVKGSQDTCWHSDNWEFVNGIFQNECIGCGKITKMPFTDLEGYDNYVDFLAYTSVYNEFLRGINPPDNTVFAPTRTINRATLVTILYRMAGEPYANGGNPYSSTPFTDIIDSNAYYYDAACWALKNGITTETTFKPFDNVTREQTATLLFRYAKLNDMIGYDGYKDVNLKSEYLDASLIHPWAVEAMQWANYNDMITGTLQGFANPGFATLRIHASKILYGFGYLCDIGNFE